MLINALHGISDSINMNPNGEIYLLSYLNNYYRAMARFRL